MPYAMNMQADLDARTTTPDHNLGDVALANDDNIYVYVQASEAVTSTCTVNTSTFALTDAAGNHTADVAFASGDYGWVRQTAKVSP